MMDFYNRVLDLLISKTSENPAVFHIDMTGLMHFGPNDQKDIKQLIASKLDRFNSLMNDVGKSGGNIFIPAFSYSFSSQNNEGIYHVNTSPSSVGQVNEYVRSMNTQKRTVDPMLSYTIFGNNPVFHHFVARDYDSFGKGSLIANFFSHQGYLCAIGPVLRRMTEAHYVEKELQVPYRKDYIFKGQIVDHAGVESDQSSVFYGRELNSPYEADFSNLEKHLRAKNLVESWEIGRFRIEAVRSDILREEMHLLYKNNHSFFICDLETKQRKNRGVL